MRRRTRAHVRQLGAPVTPRRRSWSKLSCPRPVVRAQEGLCRGRHRNQLPSLQLRVVLPRAPQLPLSRSPRHSTILLPLCAGGEGVAPARTQAATRARMWARMPAPWAMWCRLRAQIAQALDLWRAQVHRSPREDHHLLKLRVGFPAVP